VAGILMDAETLHGKTTSANDEFSLELDAAGRRRLFFLRTALRCHEPEAALQVAERMERFVTIGLTPLIASEGDTCRPSLVLANADLRVTGTEEKTKPSTEEAAHLAGSP
jgi:hypothetical protein